jgi:hypothetical protein
MSRPPRWSARLPAQVQEFAVDRGELALGRLSSTRVRNVSAEGAFLEGVELPPGRLLHVYLGLPEGYTECFAQVVHHRPAGLLDGAGVRFLRMTEASKARLHAYLDHRREIDRITDHAAAARQRALDARRRFS